MRARTALSLAIFSTLMLPAAALAQEEHRIGGKAIPQDQVSEVQEKCDAMRQGEEPSPVAEAAGDEPTKEAGADAAADTAVALSSNLWSEDGSRIDPEKLTIELCDEGDFELSVDQNSN